MLRGFCQVLASILCPCEGMIMLILKKRKDGDAPLQNLLIFWEVAAVVKY